VEEPARRPRRGLRRVLDRGAGSRIPTSRTAWPRVGSSVRRSGLTRRPSASSVSIPSSGSPAFESSAVMGAVRPHSSTPIVQAWRLRSVPSASATRKRLGSTVAPTALPSHQSGGYLEAECRSGRSLRRLRAPFFFLPTYDATADGEPAARGLAATARTHPRRCRMRPPAGGCRRRGRSPVPRSPSRRSGTGRPPRGGRSRRGADRRRCFPPRRAAH